MGQTAKYSQRAFVVRNSPNSGRRADVLTGPFSANNELMRCSKRHSLFDHLVGAGEQASRVVCFGDRLTEVTQRELEGPSRSGAFCFLLS
jgi:hypothetical protein